MQKKLASFKGFRYAMITLSLYVLIIILHVVEALVEARFFPYGILLLAIIALTIIGFIDSIKGINDPNSTRKTAGLILNSCYLILFLSMLIGNIIDVYKAFR